MLDLVPVLLTEGQRRHVQGQVGDLEQPRRMIGQGKRGTLGMVIGFAERDLALAPGDETGRGDDQHERESPHDEADPADRPPEPARQRLE